MVENLNELLQPMDAPVANRMGTASFVFDSVVERGSVLDSKLGDIRADHIIAGTIGGSVIYGGTISANQINGGTLTLGGTANGYGVANVLDPSGSALANLDNTGLDIYGNSGTTLGRGIAWYTDSNKGTLTAAIGIPSSGKLNITTGVSSPQKDIFVRAHANLDLYGSISANLYADQGTALVDGNRVELTSYGDDIVITSYDDVYLSAGGGATNNIIFSCGGSFTVNGTTKTAIVPTSRGFRALYCMESPEVWFMDFATNVEEIDPMFLEVTQRPYHIIKCEDGYIQVWGKRKGHPERFEHMSEKQAIANNKFWSQAHKVKDSATEFLKKIFTRLKSK